MKKIICILLATMMLMSILLVPAYAQEIEDSEYLYEDAFVEEYVGDREVSWHYEEVYYHYTGDETIDWCLIKGEASEGAAAAVLFLKFEDFILRSPSLCYPFDMKYAVYDVKKDEFVDLVDDYDKLSEYDGLIDVLRNLNYAMPLGDTNHDNEITILDATRIQRDVAQILRLYDEYSDQRGVTGRFSDYNNDGETTILDATAIQMKLAKVEA